MGGTWWFRFSVILFALFGSIYVLLPSFLGESAADRISAQVDSVDGAELEEGDDTLPSWLPDTRINLGLDLQGGIDLTLSVDVDEAVRSAVGRDVQTVEDLLQRNEIVAKDVRRAPLQTRPLLRT